MRRFVLTAILLTSFGLVFIDLRAALVIPPNSDWQYFKGTQEASSPVDAWRMVGFDDATWLTGQAPFFYENSSGYSGNTDLGGDMSGNYSCIFMRKTFNIADPVQVGSLMLDIRSDDGCVIWINGMEVASLGRPASPITFQGTAANANDEPKTGTPSVNDTSFLVAGENVIAVQAFNVNLSSSSDFLIEVSMTSSEPDFDPPVISSITPTPGTVNQLTQVTVAFNEPVTGIRAADLLLNGFPTGNMTGGPQTFTFTFQEPPFGMVGFEWVPNHGITDFAFPPNDFDDQAAGATWQYDLVDNVAPTVDRLAPPPNATVRSLNQIDVQFSETVVGLDAADLLINGVPATGLISQPAGLFTFEFTEPATGQVQVAWSATAGITDQAAVPNPFAGGSWNYILDPNAPPPDLVLNEVLAGNVTGLTDEDGEAHDWVEIWNRGGSAVDLQGWALSDDEDVTDKWVFPSVVLGPDEYLVLFASGKDIKQPTGNNRMHLNFKLGILGEDIGLYSPDSPRELAGGVSGSFPEMRNDHSYGPDSNGDLRYFDTPTPGAANGTSSIVGVVEPIHFSVTRGRYSEPFTLTLSTPTRGATIYFTTEGSVPTPATGQRYLTPMTIDDTTLLRVAAYRDGYLPSLTATHTYLFNLSEAFASLPVISVVGDTNHFYGPTGIVGINGGSGPPSNEWVSGGAGTYHNPSASLNRNDGGKAWERPTSVEWIEEDNGGFGVDCGIRVHGSNWTRPRYTATDKYAFKIYMRGDYGPGRLEYAWFPNSVDTSLDEVVLRDGHNDGRNPFIIDELMRRLHADMGQVASHGTFGNFLLNGVPMIQSGQPENFYFNPVNRVKEGFLQAWHGGGTEWDIIGPFGDSQGGGDRVEWTRMESFIRNNNFTGQANYETASDMLDMVNFVDYLVVNTYGATWDWPHNNWRAARERVPEGIFRFYIWDAEGAFYTQGRSPTYNNFTDTSQGLADTEEIATFYQRLRLNAEHRLLWADRIQKHYFNGGALVESNITARFDEMRDLLRGVLPNMDQRIRNDWIPRRRAVIMGQYGQQGLLAAIDSPSFSQHGGNVSAGFGLTMSANQGTVYYTLDGSDPRVAFTGAIAPNATAYVPGNPVILNEPVVAKARAFDGSDWSAIIEAEFNVGMLGLPLRITEIMYHPAGNNDAHEYLELQNVGPAPINVSGLFFMGITYIFPDNTILQPGQTWLLASDNDLAAFATRYPGVQPDDTFGGTLSNGGERLEIQDVTGNILLSTDYRDRGGWPEEPDGDGFSLEIINPFGAQDEPANWRASSAPNGSPGIPGAVQPLPDVHLNEVMADNLTATPNGSTFPDWVELHNSSASAVDLTGWSLSDDGDPRKFVFPNGTTIAANGYLVIWCDDATNTTPGLHADFALNRNEENVLLYDANTNRVDAVSLGYQISDLTVGRIAGMWTLNTPTPDAANAAAGLAPSTDLSLNEWMANPLPGEDDWVELYNTSATLPVSLQNLYFQVSDSVAQLSALAFLEPNGYIQLRADENPGPDHLDLRLPAVGSTIILFGSNGDELDRVTYGNQFEGTSRGRLPDGGPSLRFFTGSSSPGAANYLNTYTGPNLNEVLARNRNGATTPGGNTADWFEIYNPSAAAFDLSGMSVSVNDVDPGEWIIPAGTVLGGQSYLLVWCDGSQPATTNSGPFLNTGQSLDGESGGVYLFSPEGQILDSLTYGHQVADLSLGRVNTIWRLMDSPTPGAANSGFATLGSPAGIVFNEWMANPSGGNDWFELYNAGDRPVDMAGMNLTDDPSLSGMTNHVVAEYSYIGAEGWVAWQASGDPDAGRNHVDFSLDAQGESLLLYASNGTLLDSVAFDIQFDGVSEGLLPDGVQNLVLFRDTATPGARNYLPSTVIINEALTHTDPPFEDAIELHNPSSSPIDVSGWYLSDDARNQQKFQIPGGTIIPAQGYAVFYENQFNDGSQNAFALNSARGGEIWLSAVGPGNVLNGFSDTMDFGAAFNGVSFGPIVTPEGIDVVALSQTTFGVDNPADLADFRTGTGGPNAAPQVGPVVINEIMYHPPDLLVDGELEDNSRDEFIELYNATGSAVDLFDPSFPANTWRLDGAVDYTFPTGTTLGAGDYLLVVKFDPQTDVDSLNAFRATYSLDPSVALMGPYDGKLDNSGESVRLFRPDTPQMAPSPDAGYVPQILADRVDYKDRAPWPVGDADGNGHSLQKANALDYGNNPLHLVADVPTPGAANGSGVVAPPVITASPVSASALPGDVIQFSVGATGDGPLSYQWRYEGKAIRGATNAMLLIDYAIIPDNGTYDVIVSNAGGSAVSASAFLQITAPPIISVLPQDQKVDDGGDATFTAAAIGPGPLTYQWYRDGAIIPGATLPSLELTGLALEDAGTYEIRVSNPNATVSAAAQLVVLVRPVVLLSPQSQTVVEGSDVTFSVKGYGTIPMGFRWRQGSSTVKSEVGLFDQSFFTLFDVSSADAGGARRITVVLTNEAFFLPGVLSRPAILTVLTDTDGDGLSDDYENANGLNPNDPSDANTDNDGDGMTALEETLAGTDDNDPNSYLRISSLNLDGSGARVRFNAVSSKTYTLYYREDLDGAPWEKLTDVPAQGATQEIEIIDPAAANQSSRYYQLVTPREE